MATTANPKRTERKIRGVLIDLSGTLHIGDEAIPGARDALTRLRAAAAAAAAATTTTESTTASAAAAAGSGTGLVVRFLTNTSTMSIDRLLDHLNGTELGFGISPEELITSLKATVDHVKERNLRPLLLLEDASDFGVDGIIDDGTTTTTTNDDDDDDDDDSVVVGLAPSRFGYEDLNRAFRVLLDHPDNLIAVHRGTTVKEQDGSRSLGPGAFVRALETAAGCAPATVLGKPNRAIFDHAVRSMNGGDGGGGGDGGSAATAATTTIRAEDVCMIGDDVRADCRGALDAGIGTAILVRTGKYRGGDEEVCRCWRESPATGRSSDDGDDDDYASGGRFLVRPSIVEAIDFVLESM